MYTDIGKGFQPTCYISESLQPTCDGHIDVCTDTEVEVVVFVMPTILNETVVIGHAEIGVVGCALVAARDLCCGIGA